MHYYLYLALGLLLLPSFPTAAGAQTQLVARGVTRYGMIGSYNANAPFSLLGNEGVQTELKLSQEQKDKIIILVKQTHDRLEANRLALQARLASKELARSDYLKQSSAGVQRIVGEAALEFTKLLTTEQSDRLLEIRWQALGLEDDSLLKSLDLSAEQLTRLKELEADYVTKSLAISRDTKGEQRLKKIHDLNRDRLTAKEAVLTADQRERVTQAQGKEFDLNHLRRGFGAFARPGSM